MSLLPEFEGHWIAPPALRVDAQLETIGMFVVFAKPNHSKKPSAALCRAGAIQSAGVARSTWYVILLLGITATARAECTAHSAPTKVALLELYTSEGCNSCPPADRWLSQLPSKGIDSSRIVALAFHVDYWNMLGWRDRFSSSRFSDRQRIAASRSGARFVYTPQFLLNGQDTRPLLSFSRFEHAVHAINGQAPDARLSLTQRRDGSRLTVNIAAKRSPGDGLQVFVALIENGLETEVRAGENAGKKLRHDFVVRALKDPIDWTDKLELEATATFDLDHSWRESEMNVAAFVQNATNGNTAQALAAPLCRN